MLMPMLQRVLRMLLLSLLLSGAGVLHGQGSISVHFRENPTRLQNEVFSTNLLVLRNPGGQSRQFEVLLLPPGGWRLWGPAQRSVEVAPGDSAFVPVRLTAAGSGSGTFTLQAVVRFQGMQVGSAEWTFSQELPGAWTARLLRRDNYFTWPSDTTSVALYLNNSGARSERLLIKAGGGADLLGGPEGDASRWTQQVLLAAGRDTIVQMPLRLALKSSDLHSGNAPYQAERYRLQLQVSSEAGEGQAGKVWNGGTELLRPLNSANIRNSRYLALPLTVDLQTYNLVSSFSHATLSLYGSSDLPWQQGRLSYYYQSSFVQEQIDWASFIGNYHYLGYFNRIFSVEAGNISMNRAGASVSGKGLRGSYLLGNNRLTASYVLQPDLRQQRSGQGASLQHQYQGAESLETEVYLQWSEHLLRQTEQLLATADLRYRLAAGHQLRLGGGYSNEQHVGKPDSVVQVPGYLAKAGYQGSYGAFQVGLNGLYGTPGYLAHNGLLSLSGTISYRMDVGRSLSLQTSHYDYTPERYVQGVLLNDSLFHLRQRAALLFQLRRSSDGFGAGPSWYRTNSQRLEAMQYGVDLNYSSRLGSTGVFAQGFAGVLQFPQEVLDEELFVSQWRATLRHGDWNASLRYYYGPYTTLDQMEYLQSDFFPQKIYFNVGNDWWMLNRRLQLNTDFQYFYATYQKRQQLNLRPELFYRTPGGFEFSIYGRYMVYGNGSYQRELVRNGSLLRVEQPAVSYAQTEFGAGLRFDLNVPLSRPRNFDAEFVVFRDVNGNGVQDPNEAGLPNVLVRLQTETPMSDPLGNDFMGAAEEHLLITDARGRVAFRNLPKGAYAIETMALSGGEETKRFYREVQNNRTLYLPYSEGARVSGSLLVERDRYGGQRDVFVDNIRVTASNVADGNSYSTLTDREGRYVIYLPVGEYTVEINPAAIDARFDLEENNIKVEVRGTSAFSVHFRMIERRRTIRMAPGNGGGNEDTNEE